MPLGSVQTRSVVILGTLFDTLNSSAAQVIYSTIEKMGWRTDMSVGLMVELTVEEIASGIERLSRKDREALLLLLSGERKR